MRIEIPPEKIIWAAERGGFSIEKLFDFYPRAKNWIEQTERPTFKQLEDFAKKVHVPFGFLFLKDNPDETVPVTFYRSNGLIIDNPPIEIKDLVSTLKKKQNWLRDYLIENNYESLSFIGLLKEFNDWSVDTASKRIRSELKIDEEWFKKTNKSQVFRFWIDLIESNRIFVSSTGFVKHNKRPVPVDICKGFTLIDEYCPFIYINTNNLGGGRIFTLIHELVHILVGNSIGIGYEPIHPSSVPLEKFCDAVAAELLVPNNQFIKLWKENKTSLTSKIRILSNKFLVSQLVILKKAFDNNFIQANQFWDFYNSYVNSFSSSTKDNVTGNYWNTKPYEVSRKFFNHVDRALKRGAILPTEAYRLTNMKGNTYENFRTKGL
jgi:Zn-dependent peptidase ImmA (M78 family)